MVFSLSRFTSFARMLLWCMVSAALACSRARLLLLFAVECSETTASNLHDFEAHTRDVTNCVPTPAKASNQHFVVLINEIQTAITRHEASYLFSVLDQLHPGTFADC